MSAQAYGAVQYTDRLKKGIIFGDMRTKALNMVEMLGSLAGLPVRAITQRIKNFDTISEHEVIAIGAILWMVMGNARTELPK